MLATALTLAVLGVSCRKDVLRGEGNITTMALSLPAFTGVETHYDIRAEISYGNIPDVKVTGYENLLNELTPEVENGVLKLKYNSRYHSVRNGNLVARITIPVVSKAVIHGSGDILLNGFTMGNTLETRIHGSGDIRVTGSIYQQATLGIYGSGETEASGLQATEAVANIYGSGNISVAVASKLKAGIYGSGNVYYSGNPALETIVQGSGRVIKR